MPKKSQTKKIPQNKNVALLIATFNEKLTSAMQQEAEKTIRQQGWNVQYVVRVPGCYELPLAARRIITNKTSDALVVLGWIEKGKTLHGEVMGHVVQHALINLELEYNIPIGIGIIGPGATEKQAWQRARLTAADAVHAAIQMTQITL